MLRELKKAFASLACFVHEDDLSSVECGFFLEEERLVLPVNLVGSLGKAFWVLSSEFVGYLSELSGRFLEVEDLVRLSEVVLGF